MLCFLDTVLIPPSLVVMANKLCYQKHLKSLESGSLVRNCPELGFPGVCARQDAQGRVRIGWERSVILLRSFLMTWNVGDIFGRRTIILVEGCPTRAGPC